MRYSARFKSRLEPGGLVKVGGLTLDELRSVWQLVLKRNPYAVPQVFDVATGKELEDPRSILLPEATP